MVFSTATLDSLYDLAAVVRGDYTTPSRGNRELKREEMDQACRLRVERGWHAWHIAEAMGLAKGNNSYQWEENIVEALEGCMDRRDWGKARPLTRAQATVAGTNTHGEFRKTAKTNAIVEALLSPGRTGTPDIPGAGQRPRQIGRRMIKAGKDKTAKELAAQADRILADQKEAGLYPQYERFPKNHPGDIRRSVLDLGELFDWVGRQRDPGWGGRPKEEKEKVDAEIIRRCKEQAVKTPGRPPWGFYRRVAEEVYKTTPCCGPDLNQTMEAMEYTPFVPNYVNILCVESGIFGKQESVADAVADPVNIKKVEAAIVKITSKRRAWQVLSTEAIPVGASPLAIVAETGLRRGIVERILANLGYVTKTTRTTELRAIILPLHDKKLTPYQMWEQTPELQKQWPLRRIGARVIRSMLLDADPPREPWTDELLRADRVLPERVAQIRAVIQSWLRTQAADEEFMTRVRRNVQVALTGGVRPSSIYESMGIDVNRLAALLRETPDLTRKFLAVLFAETPQFVAMHPDERFVDELVIPLSGLQWIIREGE